MMKADSLKIVEEPAPSSSVREAVAAEPVVSIELRGADVAARARPVEPADYAMGQLLAGKYRVERKIGEGAMGVVLAATHVGLDEPVAIKFMRPEAQRIEGTVERFAKEAKIAARIRSEHIAKVLDVGELEPLGPYIVMEYLEGKSLADVLDRGGPMPAERVVEYLLQACEALAAAHAVGVVHRDVKPDNLFLARQGGLETIKLLDFGISKAVLRSGASGGDVGASTTAFVLGTPLYMSPEQLRSWDIDCRTDVWSMGAVMYELLTGVPPFRAASIPEICAEILESTPTPLPATSPAGLQAVVMRCLEKDRERRFQTIAELATALVPFAPGDARAYATRSSGILRASASGLNVAVVAGGVDDEATRAVAPRAARFHSSALVAAATVLAISALGITIIVAKMPGADAPSAGPVVAPMAAASTVAPTAAATPPPPSSSVATPSLTAGVVVPASVEAAAVVPPPRAQRTVARAPLPPVEAVPVERAVDAAPKARAARTTPRASLVGQVAPASPSTLLEPESEHAGSMRVGRVRLVEPRPRLRLVDRVGEREKLPHSATNSDQ